MSQHKVSLVLLELLHNETVKYAHRTRPEDAAEADAVVDAIARRVGGSMAQLVQPIRVVSPHSASDVMRFVGRDLWGRCFGRVVSSLTTSEGEYQLHDNPYPLFAHFPPQAPASSTAPPQLPRDQSSSPHPRPSAPPAFLPPRPLYAVYTAGLIRGALDVVGFDASVEVQTQHGPPQSLAVVITPRHLQHRSPARGGGTTSRVAVP